MKKLLSVFGAIAFTATSSSTVASCQKNKIPLSTVITVQNLGAIKMEGSKPTLDELITAIKAKNPSAGVLNKENVALVGESATTSAMVKGVREYQDNVRLSYTKAT